MTDFGYDPESLRHAGARHRSTGTSAADLGGFDVSELAGGAIGSFEETGEMLVELNPLRALTEPAEYGDTLFRYAGGIAAIPGAIIDRPLDFADQMLFGGELRKEQWDRARGQTVSAFPQLSPGCECGTSL
jgi:hypothetical protein